MVFYIPRFNIFSLPAGLAPPTACAKAIAVAQATRRRCRQGNSKFDIQYFLDNGFNFFRQSLYFWKSGLKQNLQD